MPHELVGSSGNRRGDIMRQGWRWVSILCGVAVCALPAGAATADTGSYAIELESYTFDPLGSGEPPLPADLRADDEGGLALIQLAGPVEENWLRTLEGIGAELHEYIPNFAFLASLDAGRRAAAAELAFVRWIGSYHPAYKISSRIGTLELIDPERLADSDLTLIVQVVGDPEAAADEVAAIGLDAEEIVPGVRNPRLVVKAPPDAVDQLAQLPHVWWIEEKPDFIVMNNTTRWVVQSNASLQTPVWDQGIHGEGEIVTMMDTGLDYNSCWFRETGNAPPGPTHRKVIDYQTWGGQAYDGCGTGHGTHVAGTCVGDQSYINGGNFNYNGMAYAAKITVQDVGNDDFFSCLLGLLAVPSSLSGAFTDSYNLGARVHTNSWGSTSNSYDSYAREVDAFMWANQDFLIVFAAGNSGPGSGTVGSPGTAKDCITVGATRQAPQQDVIAGYSSRGPTGDNRYKPTVTAPGGESPNYIFSADNHSGSPPSPTCNVVGNPFQGTSMATPAVSGCAMLVRQYYREGWYPSGSPVSGDGFVPSAALVKATAVNAA
ncbi:MAG: S8 family serine peptidase, partial [Candidatus Eisenbacteria bacterium]|nr:S8 family serine peptidase [Candidatus Eisenbacteria bacterium]